MGSSTGTMWRRGIGAVLALGLVAAQAGADVTTERGSSILVFPKLLFDTGKLITPVPTDTVIQISNTSNNLVFAHCFYVNAAPLNPALPPGPLNPPQWQEVDFDIILTKQQPTYWVLGAGRRYDPTDPLCSPTVKNCSNAGFDPGLIPPVQDPFVGELKCIEVDSAGAPLNGNHLKGEVQIVADERETGVGSREVSKYNAIGIMGLNTDLNSNDGDPALCLGGGVSPLCPAGAEYNACPAALVLNHFAEGASDPVINVTFGGASEVSTELTIVPCTEDFENQRPTSVTVQFRVTNEFEELFSASTTVTCWGTFALKDVGAVFEERFLGTRFAQTRMVSPDEQSGFLAVVEESHYIPKVTGYTDVARTALNVPVEGERPNGDVILVPEGP